MSRPVRILLGLIIGGVLGIIANQYPALAPQVDWAVKNIAQPIGQIFLRLIFMIVVPLVFSSLLLGIYEMGDMRRLGRVGVKTLIVTVISSVVSVFVGLFLVQVFNPGKGLDQAIIDRVNIEHGSSAVTTVQQANSSKSLSEILVSLLPKNPLAAASQALEGEMISLMVFTVFFGIALVLVRGGKEKDPFIGFMESVRDVSMKIVDMAMAFAPIGVAALMFALTARFGWGLMGSLGKYVAVVLIGLLFQQLVVYGAVLKFYVGLSPFKFLREIREVIFTAFSTASSNATLPTAIRVSQDNLKLDSRISTFVLTVGSTANQNGTALFEGVTILFLAQVFGVELTMIQQVLVMTMSVLAGVGTAGVPGGSLPLIVIVLQSVHIPAEGIGIILGVDRFLDMCRTVLNVSGDIVVATIIDHSESGAKKGKRLARVK